MKEKSDAAAVQNKKKLILPPGLSMKLSSFISHYKVSRGGPVMIMGDTGVGKSLFLQIYECLWKEERKDGSAVWANCAHFGGSASDPNIARSELFGYDPSLLGKTGRPGYQTKIKPGLIDKANNGLLILEEIGELPPEVQAMLLTFVETGYYRAVGSDSDKRAIVRIVGSTNRESALRDDFRYRFFPFYVPPVYQRRKDVLYYIAATDQELLKTLTPWEVLILLGYNWPGNVREIERVCQLLERRRKLLYCDPQIDDPDIFAPEDHDPLDRLMLIEKMDTALDAMQVMKLREDLKAKGVDVELLEHVLQRYGVGIDDKYSSSKHPFSDYDPTKSKRSPEMEKLERVLLKKYKGIDDKHPPSRHPFEDNYLKRESTLEKRFHLKTMRDYSPFDQAYLGYRYFCSLFFQNPEGNSSVFDMEAPTDNDAVYSNELGKHAKALQALRVQIFEYRSGIKLPQGKQIPIRNDERKSFFNNLADEHPDNKFLVSITGRNVREEKPEKVELDIYSIPYKEFMTHYHKKLIERYGGNVAEAARKTQVKYQTLQSRLREYKFQ